MEPVNESTSGSLKWLVLPTLAAEVVLSGIMLGCYALFAALRQEIPPRLPRSVPPPRW